MTDEQTGGRKKNGALPEGRPDAHTSDEAVRRTGRKVREKDSPNEADSGWVGETFKKSPGS